MSQLNNAQLVVEGKNDQHVIWALCEQYGVKETFTVETPNVKNGGVDSLLNSIPVRLKTSRLTALGIVLDADQNLEGRWQSVKNRLLESGYVSLPEKPDPEGTLIIQPKMPKIGVWIMPNNHLPGMLENFIAELIPDQDELSPLAKSILQEIEQKNLNRYSPNQHPKAFIHTWLAWQENPGQPMGQAITAHVLNHNVPLAKSFIKWLGRVFNEDYLL